MSRQHSPPQVTGISPKEGPPGTRVTIRGENFGSDSRDLTGLRICGVDCLLSAEWKSPNKIVARTGQAKGSGDIIVTTRHGGEGTCTVSFRGYNIQIGPLQESAIWVDESQFFDMIHSGIRPLSPALTDDFPNPLGLSDETSDSKVREEELLEMFPEGSGNSSLENFEPAWFMLENHRAASFDDLKAGLLHLKRTSGDQKEGPLVFIKANLSTFLDSYNKLTEMHNKMYSDKSKSKGLAATSLLEETLFKSNKAAETVFKDILGRKDRADATRNVLSILNRFKLLFYLPNTIERNIQKCDYDLVITDYTRAKSLFSQTEIHAFRRVYNEVENRIAAFRNMLYKKLMVLPSTVEEQKRLIRYLVHLEAKGDPAWECLLNMHSWIIELMQRCLTEHIDKEKSEDKEQSKSMMSSSAVRSEMKTNFKSGGKMPQRIIFVELLTKILCDNIPDLWRLGHSYLSGKLLKEVKKQSRIDSAKQQHFMQIIHAIISRYASLVRSAFLPHTLEQMDRKQRAQLGVWHDPKYDSPLSWLPVCVRHLRSCVFQMSLIELPQETSDILHQLTFDLRWSCVETLLKQTVHDVKSLHERETWIVDTDDERGGTTHLPALFESIVVEIINVLHEVVTPRDKECPLFAEETSKKRSANMCIEVLQSFADTLKNLTFTDQKHNHNATTPAATATKNSTDALPSLDKRLIVMMSNCAVTYDHILPRLMDSFQRRSYTTVAAIRPAVESRYKSMQQQLFTNYIEEKSNVIIGVLEQNMNAGKFDWKNCPSPSGVRNYIKQLIVGMLTVHAEVYSVCPIFLDQVMRNIVIVVAEELSRLFQCVPEYSSSGCLQARLDLAAFESSVSVYITDATKTAIQEARKCLTARCTVEEKRINEELLGVFQKQFRFYLVCFQTDRRLLKTSTSDHQEL